MKASCKGYLPAAQGAGETVSTLPEDGLCYWLEPDPPAGGGEVEPLEAPGVAVLAAGGCEDWSFDAVSSPQAAMPRSIIGANKIQSLLRIRATLPLYTVACCPELEQLCNNPTNTLGDILFLRLRQIIRHAGY